MYLIDRSYRELLKYWNAASLIALRRSVVLALLAIGQVRLGIAWRLGISFAAVGILAAAANLIVEQGVTLVGGPAPPVPIAAPVVAPLVAQATEPVLPPVIEEVSSKALVAALDRFEAAAYARSQAETPENTIQLQRAGQDLDRVAKSFLQEANALLPTPLKRLASALENYQATAQEMVALADKRRVVSGEYAERFEAMNARIKKSVDAAWRIFGRVVARQSLIQLTNDLDEIRRRFASLSATGFSDRDAVDALVAGEAAFVATLEKNERSFASSQGEEWIRLTRQDAAAISQIRVTLLQTEEQWRSTESRLAQGASTVRRLTPDKIVAAAGSVVPESRQLTAQPPSDPLAAMARTPEETGLASTPPEPVVEAAPVQQPDTRRGLVAWLTGAVLVVLLIISAGTVVSIVRPVRRLLQATARLAKGMQHEPVPRGGIKELDTLAVAFNQMAEELTTAKTSMQNYQQQLEAKVEERTLQLQELAERDSLTQLPNRRQLFVLLNAAIEQAAQQQRFVGVLFLDIDNFKNINDCMGHAFGDRVLTAIAARLDEAVRAVGFAARLGGDEFTVVVSAAAIGEIRSVGEKVISAFQQPLSIDGRDLIVSMSVGASVYPDHEHDAEALLRAADAALFRAKALGRSQLSMFTPDLLADAAARFATEQGLRRAIERGEFELVFQPELCAETMETTLVEALIRWRLPDGRLVSPGEFLAVAEESGLILEIGDWVLRSAIETASRWHHGAWPQAKVAINVSPRQLLDHGFVQKVLELLAEFELPARCIEIELTENVLQTGPLTIETLRRLRSQGIAIALDDFGTGYSSLASLEQLPLTRIKLDRSLIASIDNSERSAAIIRSIIGLCQGLGLEVTAEGIERAEQFAMLASYRDMYLQGYLLSRPVSADDLLPVMAKVAQEARLLILTRSEPPYVAADTPAQPILLRQSNT